MSEPSTDTEIFDVFLCHNSEDKPEVREIASKLVDKGIKPWLDEEQIIGGRLWQEEIEKQITRTKAAAIFVGMSGIGPWQNQEIRTLLDQFVNGKFPIIPVILTSAKETLEIPLLLKNLHWIDFRVANPDPLKQLIRAISVEKPDDPSIASSIFESYMPKREDLFPPQKNEEWRLTDLGISDTRRYPAIVSAPKGEQRDQLLILLARVKENWVDGVLKHSLFNEIMISLGKRTMEQAVKPPWKHFVEFPGLHLHLNTQDCNINSIFDATSLLLILGEPGSGKTTTLLELASDLIERARSDPKERVPVVLNLSSWKKKQTLDEWIVGELSAKYRIPRKIGKDWLYRDYLLPLLDGLDEVNIELQPACVSAINEFINKFEFVDKIGPSGLVVCCRLMEYQWLPEPLNLNGAIGLELLGSNEVNEFLTNGGAQLAGLRQVMSVDPVLQELSQTPLMLSIVSLTYEGVGVDDLAKQKAGSSEERREQIFSLYVERMFQRKDSINSPFSRDKAIGWLVHLAKGMKEHSQSVFMVEELQPGWLNTRGQMITYGAFTALIVACIFGLFLGLSEKRSEWLSYGLRFGLSILLGVGLGCWFESPLRRGFMSALIGVLIAGLSFGHFGLVGLLINVLLGGLTYGELSYMLSSWLRYVQTLGLDLVLNFGLILGLIGGVGVGSLKVIRPVETFRWQWKQFRRKVLQGWKIGLIVGLIVFLSVMLSGDKRIGPTLGPTLELIIRLSVGLFIAVIGMIVYGLLGGMTDTVRVDKSLPNQGINLSLKNALLSIFIVGLSSGLIFGLSSGLRGGLSAGPIFGLIFGLNRGGSAVFKHYPLRFILWIKGYTPFKFIKFLDHCTKLILLKKVGGGYMFIHRMLLEHFAKMELKPTKTKKSK